MPITVQTNDFESIEKEWEEILPRTKANTIFVTPWWQKVWWSHFGEGAELLILSVRDGDELIGVAPLMMKQRVLSFLGDTDLFDYHDFLVLFGREGDFYNALCDHIAGLEWDALELKSLRDGSPTLVHLRDLASSKGYTAHIEEEDVAPVAVLGSTWDEHLGSLRKKDRHELRRKLRRLENADHARQYSCETPLSLSESLGDFFRLLRASSPEKDAFLTFPRESFFRDIAEELAGRGQFKLYFLEVGDVRVASCICFDYADAYLLYNSGYDPEYSFLSVGLLNKAFCIKEAIEMGRETFDFLRGTERYKYDLGGNNSSVYQMLIRRKSTTV